MTDKFVLAGLIGALVAAGCGTPDTSYEHNAFDTPRAACRAVPAAVGYHVVTYADPTREALCEDADGNTVAAFVRGDDGKWRYVKP